jgi:hypothetical protein
MRIGILYLFYLILLTGCNKTKFQDVYDIGISKAFEEIRDWESDAIFSHSICSINSKSLENDIEFKEYIKRFYIDKGYKNLGMADNQFLFNILNKYFEEVESCNLPSSKKSIRDLCRQNGILCFGATPIYKSENGDYFFSVTMPPNIGVEIKVDKDLKPEILNLYIK